MESVVDTVYAHLLDAGDTIEHNGGFYEVTKIEDGRHGDRGLIYVYVEGEDDPITMEVYDEVDLIGYVYSEVI